MSKAKTKTKRSTKAPAPARKRGGKPKEDVIEIVEVVDAQTPKPNGKRAKATPTPEHGTKYAEAFAAWQDGATIHELVKSTGLKRPALRRALIKQAGGKDAFKALRAEGAGGKAEPFGGKRATPRAKREKGEAPAPMHDDAGVPRVDSTSKAAGWSCRFVPGSTGMIPVSISPDGIEYVPARATEKADLIRVGGSMGDVRLRKLETSHVAKHARKTEKLVQHGEKALERTRARKRAARQSRTTNRGGKRS